MFRFPIPAASEITPRTAYLSRRSLLVAAALPSLASAALPATRSSLAGKGRVAAREIRPRVAYGPRRDTR